MAEKKFEIGKILSIILPLVLFYAAFDNGGWQDISRISLSIGILLMGFLVFVLKPKIAYPPPFLTLSFIGFLIISLLSFTWSESPEKTQLEIIYLFTLFSVFMITVNFEEKYRKDFVTLLIGGATVIAVIGYVFYLMPILGMMEKTHDMMNFFFATFYWKNPAAGYLMLFIPIVLFNLLDEQSKKSRVLYSIVFVLLSTAFILTRSRGGYIALATSCIIFFFVYLLKYVLKRFNLSHINIPKNRLLSISISLALVVILSLILLPSKEKRNRSQVVVNGSSEPQERSSTERILMLELGLRTIKDNPMGVGLGAFISAYPRYLENSLYLSKHLHNQYLQYLVEIGILGGVIFGFFILAVVIALFQTTALNVINYKTGILIGVMAYFIHIAVDFDWTFAGTLFPAFALAGIAISSNHNNFEISNRYRFLKYCFIGTFVFLTFISITQLVAISAFEKTKVDQSDFENDILRATKLSPFSATYRFYYASWLESVGRNDEAKALYEDILKLEPNNAQVNYQYGKYLVEQFKSYEGIEYIENSITYAPYSSPIYYLYLAELYKIQNQNNEALRILNNAIGKFSSDENEKYNKRTYSYKYTMGSIYNELYLLNRETSDSAKSKKYEETALKLSYPREKDKLAEILGVETQSPEWIATKHFEAIQSDSIVIHFDGIREVNYDLWNQSSSVLLNYSKSLNDSVFFSGLAQYILAFENDRWVIKDLNTP